MYTHKNEVTVSTGPRDVYVIVPSAISKSLQSFLRERMVTFTIDVGGISGSYGSDDVLNFLEDEDVQRLKQLLGVQRP